MKSLLTALLLLAAPALAQDVTLKLGTLAPQGSTWHSLLKELGEKWGEASGGKVKLKIYAGGTQGSESDMVRKIGVGQLQAASITNVGMHDIITDPMVFSTPGLFDEKSFGQVFPSFEKRMEAAFDAKGYVVLNWAQVGSVYPFCTKPYKTPEEASQGKFFTWDGDPGSVEAFKLMGLKPVVLASVDIVPSLQTGMISCVTQAPAFVLTARMFEKANKMMDVPFGFLIGGTVVKKDVWEKIPADVRPKLMSIAREMGKRIDAEVKKLNDDAIAAMQKQGLEVVKVDQAAWRVMAEKSWPAIRGKVVEPALFDEVAKARKALK
jgi:TRAP-type transport system periplasmic protein